MIRDVVNQALFPTEEALVVFSGGQDSTTCLHWAMQHFKKVHAVFFHYGQRHKIEENSAIAIAKLNMVPLKILHLSAFAELGGNSLVDSNLAIEQKEGSLPNTFVPGRNLIFLTYAAGHAYNLGIRHIVTGVCQTDYSGYPDCRLDTLNALEKSLQLGMEKDFKIHTPLMNLSKAQTVKMALEYGAMDSLAYSHTCYEGVFPPCGRCPSCLLRAKGFREAQIEDPILKRGL